jgi:transposase-like protein
MDCIYCLGEIVKYGRYNGIKQRYKCLKCQKTFGDAAIENFKTLRNKRLVLHLILAGCNKSEISAELEIEESIIDKWTKSYLKNTKQIVPAKPLLAVRTLITIYMAIEKSRISKLHYYRKFRTPRR